MNILLLGSGGREHALAWAIAQNPKCDTLIAAPGNPGMASLATCVALDILDPQAVADYATDNAIDFAIIGPEAPLVAGVADALRARGIRTFGPSAAAAQLEASKHFTKQICAARDVPTAGFAHFTDATLAKRHLETCAMPIVIKADGLAAGKGVVVAPDLEVATAAVDASLGQGPGAEIVIEEFMAGEEASFFVLCHGTQALPVGTAQDHKRAYDGDTGPNTGGMGAYSPAPVLTEALIKEVMERIVRPTLAEMADRGTPYEGVLYVGLMLTDEGPKLVEYNVRFGDPECQVLMMRLGAQALDLMLACADGTLDTAAPNWAEDHAITVVMAAKGYPGAYARGDMIAGLEAAKSDPLVQVFMAGVVDGPAGLETAGGRVLSATARGETLADAHRRAYSAVEAISWDGAHHRSDIGARELKRQSA